MTTRTNWILALATLAVAAWGFMGCAHGPVAVGEQAETVGTLAPSYNSIAVAPVHAATPPPSFEIAGPADDDATATATTIVRVDGGDGASEPDIAAKEAHGF